MTVTYIYNGKEYVFSNEDLKEGDEVYPISSGKIVENEYIHEEFNFDFVMSGFPDDPHIVRNLNYSEYKPYEISTDYGYGPKEEYFKIISRKIDYQIL